MLVLVWMLSFSCTRDDRERLEFNSGIDSVYNAVLLMEGMSQNIYLSDECLPHYKIKNNMLSVSEHLIPNKSVSELRKWAQLDSLEAYKFIKTAFFLNQNSISACYFEPYLNMWLFDYKHIDVEYSNSDVLICLKDELKGENKSKINILDERNGLVLFNFR